MEFHDRIYLKIFSHGNEEGNPLLPFEVADMDASTSATARPASPTAGEKDILVNDGTIVLVSFMIMFMFVPTQRYMYYIHNGIDTTHVAPLEDSWLSNVLDRVPDKYRVGH